MVQQSTTIHTGGLGPGVMVGAPHISGLPGTGGPYGYPTAVSRVGAPVMSSSIGPSGVMMGGPVVPRDPRVPMAGIDMY